MTEYYFDLEIGYDEKKVNEFRKYNRWFEDPTQYSVNRPKFEPEKAKIITIQYQQLSWGRAIEDPTILKVWDKGSSEHEIIKRFITNVDINNRWKFVFVGCNLYFDLYMLRYRAKKLGIKCEWLDNELTVYHDLPIIDIQMILLGMNGFQFQDSRLDQFSEIKNVPGIYVPVWYLDKEYGKIEDYIRKEIETFTEIYPKLKSELPKFRQERGFPIKA